MKKARSSSGGPRSARKGASFAARKPAARNAVTRKAVAPGARLQRPSRTVLPDLAGMQRAIALFLKAAHVPMSSADRARTPERVAEAWADELLAGYRADPAGAITYEPAPRSGGLVVLRDIIFHSTCVHHLLPFFGKAHIAYLPDKRLAGLSKIARAVDLLARRLQVQERLTDEIVDALMAALRPRGVACLLEAEHLCVACRGIRKSGVKIVTIRFEGRLAQGPLRKECQMLLAGQHARKRRR